MSFNKLFVVRDALTAALVDDFPIHLALVAAEQGLETPPLIEDDPNTASGKAIYFAEGVRYPLVFAEVAGFEGDPLEGAEAITAAIDCKPDVYITFRGDEAQLEAWGLVYLTALVRCFEAHREDPGEWWGAIACSVSPVGRDKQGFVRSVWCRVEMQVA